MLSGQDASPLYRQHSWLPSCLERTKYGYGQPIPVPECWCKSFLHKIVVRAHCTKMDLLHGFSLDSAPTATAPPTYCSSIHCRDIDWFIVSVSLFQWIISILAELQICGWDDGGATTCRNDSDVRGKRSAGICVSVTRVLENGITTIYSLCRFAMERWKEGSFLFVKACTSINHRLFARFFRAVFPGKAIGAVTYR